MSKNAGPKTSGSPQDETQYQAKNEMRQEHPRKNGTMHQRPSGIRNDRSSPKADARLRQSGE
jgi:hypothetical protein